MERSQMTPLPATYARAVALAARDGFTRRRRPQQLSGAAVVVHDHQITLEQVRKYAGLFGPVDPQDVPSVLVHVSAFPAAMELMADADFPLPLMGMVHLENRVEHHWPVPARTPLEVVASATNLRAHPSGTAVDLVVTVHGPADLPGLGSADDAESRSEEQTSGEPVLLWEGVSTYLAKGVRLAGAERPEPGEHPEFTAPSMTAQWRLRSSTGRDYAAVSGDYNPIHLNPWTAKALGMKGMIAHGMYLAGRMLAGREPAGAGHRWSIEFAAPVVLPTTVSVAYAHPEERTTEVLGWDARRNRPHFTGTLVLPEHRID